MTQNQSLDGDTIELFDGGYGIEPRKAEVDIRQYRSFPLKMVICPDVASQYRCLPNRWNGKKIPSWYTWTAFTSMRARGASVTDITILVVAVHTVRLKLSKLSTTQSQLMFQSLWPSTRSINQANPERVIGELAEHGVMSTAWGDSEFVEISAKFNQNIDEPFWKPSSWAEIQELSRSNCCAIGTVIEARLDSEKVRRQPSLFNKVPWMSKTQSLSEIPLDVSVLWPMTLAVVKVADHLLQFITGLERSANGGWPLCGYEDENCAAGEERAKRADETNVANQPRQPWKSRCLWRLGKWKLLMSSLKPMYKVRLEALFKRFPSKDWSGRWKWPSFTQQLVRSTNQTWPLAEA